MGTIRVYTWVEISDHDIDRVFYHKLEQLTEGRWIEGDTVMEEHCTSHRYDSKIGKVDDPQYAVNVAAIRLRDSIANQIKERAVKKNG